jgi:hypothetical protein
MSEIPERDISREDLARARDTVRLEITKFGGSSGGAAMAKLLEVLAGLKEELAETEGGTSGASIGSASEPRRPREGRRLQRDDIKATVLVTVLLVVFLLCTVFSPLVAPLLAPLFPASITHPQNLCDPSVDVTCLRKP